MVTGIGAGRPTQKDAMDTFLDRMYTTSQNPTQKRADLSNSQILQGLGSRFSPQINQLLKQNVNEKLDFESGFRRDIDDPDKMMPYMGVRFPFSTG